MGIFVVAAGLLECRGSLFVVDVADPLKEHQREDVGLEVGCVDRAAEDVGGIPEHRFEGRVSEGGKVGPSGVWGTCMWSKDCCRADCQIFGALNGASGALSKPAPAGA